MVLAWNGAAKLVGALRAASGATSQKRNNDALLLCALSEESYRSILRWLANPGEARSLGGHGR